ncbi:hypothetical protein PS928_06834 [Pseudomonas fluorescens]|uniref:Uncharacterized protein n=2 Tax=Pseudomonas fluorescens TaxID=294 RepID=A0A5E7VVN2_PSEFL|nr:hypothetical protein PS928_06834 [Pseudomonas fluorescens]
MKDGSAFMMSSKKMFGDLPPSSTVDGMMFSAAHFMMCEPTGVEPVKAILAMRLLVARASPASLPKPCTTLSTPGGSRSPISSISTVMPNGVCSAGLSTTQLPAARAGASFQAAIRIGKFHGMICPTTPSGSWM